MAEKKTRWGFKGWGGIGLLACLVIYPVWRFVPLLDSHSEQDRCTFGPASNARYQELLAEARKRTREKWPPLEGDETALGKNLSDRIVDLTQGIGSFPERIAGVHAVMRAAGAFLDNPASDKNYQGLYVYTYALNSILVGVFDPIDRYAEAEAYYSENGYAGQNTTFLDRVIEADSFYVDGVRFPSSLGRLLRTGMGVTHSLPEFPDGSPCPAVPAPETISKIEQRYRAKPVEKTR